MKKNNIDSAEKYDLREMDNDRCVALVWKSKKAKEFADKYGLEILELPSPVNGLRTPGRYIIGKKGKVGCLVYSKRLTISLPQVILDKASRLYERMRDLTPCQALKFLLDQPPLRGALERPEVAMLEGILFGYKSCDIEYYVETRYLGRRKHPYEDEIAKNFGYVFCERCARKEVNR